MATKRRNAARPLGVLAVRVTGDVLARIDALAERLSAERPGIDVSRTDVVRMLLTRGLDEEESHGKAKAKAPRVR